MLPRRLRLPLLALLAGMAGALAQDWQVKRVDGRDYVPVTDVARFYELGEIVPQPGKTLLLRSPQRELTVAENSREPSDGFLDFVMPEHGAATQVWAAVSPDLAGRGGDYLEDCGIGEAAPHARDERRAAQLWELSERLCTAR